MDRLRALLILAFLACAVQAHAWTVVDARWRADENPSSKHQVWQSFVWDEGWSHPEQFYPRYFEPSGSVHVILRNDSDWTDKVTLTHVDGKPIADLVTTPHRASGIVWYRVQSYPFGMPRTDIDPDPDPCTRQDVAIVKPHRWVECSMRFRTAPTSPVRLRFRSAAQGHVEVDVPITSPTARMEAVCFSPGIDRIYVYIRSLDGRQVGRGKVRLDGRSMDKACRWTDCPKDSGLTLVDTALDPGWQLGSHHLIEVDLSDGRRLVQLVCAWDGYFTIGLYGMLEPDRVRDARAHGINTYFTGGVSELLDKEGLNYVPSANVGEGRVRTARQSGTLFYQNRDEPDAHDFHNGRDLPVMQRLGVLAQSEVLPTMSCQRERDSGIPKLLLVDNTYKPLQWYVYGQIPDIFCTDPYAPLRGRQVDYIRYSLDVARDASTPRPLLSVLWACSLSGEKPSPGDRAPTPQEERMMAFYALGCGVKGLAYFIDLTTTTGEGRFVGLSDNKPLWEEVGKINRDVKVLAPYLSIGCPIPGAQSGLDVWSRMLLCGPDHLVLVVVNTGHHIDFTSKGSPATHEPARNVSMDVTLPSSFRQCRVEEVKDGALVPVASRAMGDKLHLELETVDTARAFLISGRPGFAGSM